MGVLVMTVGGKSTNGFFAWQTAAWGGALWLLFVMTGHFSTWGKPSDLYWGLSLVGVIESFAAIGQYVRIWPVYNDSFPVTGTFDNPAGLSACLTICFPTAIYFIASDAARTKVWGGIAVVSVVIAVILSGSRTGMVAVGYLATAAAYRYLLKGRRPAFVERMILFSIGMIVLAGLYCWKKDSADGRLLVWNCSLEMIVDAPVIGHGHDAFQAKYMDYQAKWLAKHPEALFLYNYGAELHVAELWMESLRILTECTRGLNDTDVQMLLADNYSRLGEYNQAERHYSCAAQMCPNRFMPLYRLVKLYRQTGQCAEARQLARKIVTKPVKVPSYRVNRIKREMEEYLKSL